MHRHIRTRFLAPLLVLSALLVAPTTDHASAAVVHGVGYEATVSGWTSWYGSYVLEGVGQVWCVDHGLRAPDVVLGYRPTALGLDDDTQAAMAWAIGRYGRSPTPNDAAALMLVLHQFNGAVYPFGPLVISRAPMAGFQGRESAIRARAIEIQADATAHRHLRGPVTLTLTMPSTILADVSTKVTVSVRDARQAPISGVAVTLQAKGGKLTLPTVTTGRDGNAVTRVTASRDVEIHATATTVDPRLRVYGPSGAPAQRVAAAGTQMLDATVRAPLASGSMRIHKTGDGAPAFSVEGTRFRVSSRSTTSSFTPVTVEVDADGQTPDLAVPAGRYLVEEVAPAPGYRSAGPWDVTVDAGQTRTLDVVNKVSRAGLELAKIDAHDKTPLAGATLQLRRDLDGDGVTEPVGTPFVTTDEPTRIPDLLPGNYEIVELSAPPGYERFLPQTITLTPGATASVTLEDRRIPPTTTTSSTTSTLPTTTSTMPSSPPTTTSTPSRPPSSGPPSTSEHPRTPPVAEGPPLARTGASSSSLGLTGLGAVLTGLGAVSAAGPARRRRSASRGH